jgi:predicted nucleic acid-binding protein
LRTLDAIHLATVLTLGDDLLHLVTYDERLAHAGVEAGVAVVAPGA